MIISNSAIPDDLNLRWSFRLSAVLVGLLAAALAFLVVGRGQIYGREVSEIALAAVLLSCAIVILLNRGFYLFLIGARGLGFTLRAVPLHLGYYFYSGVTFVVCWVWNRAGVDRRAHSRSRAVNPFLRNVPCQTVDHWSWCSLSRSCAAGRYGWPVAGRLAPALFPDSAEYLTIARNVAAGHGFSGDLNPPYRPDLRRTPVYPALLAGVFLLPNGDERLASFVGVLAGAATVAAMYWIAWHLFGPLAAFIGALLLTVDVTSATYSVLILTETVFTALVAAGVLVLMRRPLRPPIDVRGGLLLSGVPLSAVPPVSCSAWCRFRCAPGAILAGGTSRATMCVSTPCSFSSRSCGSAGTSSVAGAPTLSSIASVNLYFHRAVVVEARLLGKSVDEMREAWERRFAALWIGGVRRRSWSG